MFNKKHLIRNSINQVKFPSGDRNLKIDLGNLSTVAKESVANLNSSIKERMDNDLALRQRTVDEWAQSINNNKMNIKEHSFIGSQLNPEELMTRRSISSVARTT